MIKLEWPLKSQIIFYLPFFSHLLLNVNEGKRFKSLQIKHFNWLKCNHNSKLATLYGKAFQYCWNILVVQSFLLSIDSEISSNPFLCFQWRRVWECFADRFHQDWLLPKCSRETPPLRQSLINVQREPKGSYSIQSFHSLYLFELPVHIWQT